MAVIEAIDGGGNARYWLSDGGDVVRETELASLLARAEPLVGVVGVAARGRDARIDEFVQTGWRTFSTATLTRPESGAATSLASFSTASVFLEP